MLDLRSEMFLSEEVTVNSFILGVVLREATTQKCTQKKARWFSLFKFHLNRKNAVCYL